MAGDDNDVRLLDERLETLLRFGEKARIARADQTPMEGFEQDDYVCNGPFANAPISDLIEDYIAVRRATISLLRSLDETAWSRHGIANKNEVTVRALAYIIAGHELHHRRMLEEKYFSAD